MLNFVTTGTRTDKPTLVIAHGLFGSARNWGVIAKRLSDDRQVVAVDMRNHGASPWHDDHGYPDLADDLQEVIGDIDGPVDLLGHSMGGKAAMVLAVSHPPSLRRLIVADIAPVGYGHTQLHLIEAMGDLDPQTVSSRAEADAALSRAIEEPGIRAFLLQSLDMKAAKWRLNLDALERDMQQILGFPDLDGKFDGPTLFLTGAESDYVLPDHRPRIKNLFPAARFAKLPGAGHWLHADKPREFEAAIRTFLDA